MEILGINVLLPVNVTFNDGEGDKTLFVYLDQKNNNVIFTNDIISKGFKEKVMEYFKKQHRPHVIPPIPKDGFNHINPKNFGNP